MDDTTSTQTRPLTFFERMRMRFVISRALWRIWAELVPGVLRNGVTGSSRLTTQPTALNVSVNKSALKATLQMSFRNVTKRN